MFTSPPDAMLLVSATCPNCPAVLSAMSEMVKLGRVGRLEVINVEAHPQKVDELGVRAVPWVRIGPFELTGLRSRQELETWVARAGGEDALADYFHALLKEGELDRVIDYVRRAPDSLAAVLPIVANPEASLNVRIGAGAVLEEYAGQPTLQALVPALATLAIHADPRVRADACHYLGLSASTAARPILQACLQDAEAEVREIAQDGLDALRTA